MTRLILIGAAGAQIDRNRSQSKNTTICHIKTTPSVTFHGLKHTQCHKTDGSCRDGSCRRRWRVMEGDGGTQMHCRQIAIAHNKHNTNLAVLHCKYGCINTPSISLKVIRYCFCLQLVYYGPLLSGGRKYFVYALAYSIAIRYSVIGTGHLVVERTRLWGRGPQVTVSAIGIS